MFEEMSNKKQGITLERKTTPPTYYNRVSGFSLVIIARFLLYIICHTKDSKQDALIGELQKKSSSLVMNLKSVVKTKESPTRTIVSRQRDATLPNDGDGDSSNKTVPQKRKQDSFLVEVQERAEVHLCTLYS